MSRGIGNTKFVLTDAGKREVSHYIRNLEAKRKEILDAGLDTANETEIPTEEDIIADISVFADADGWYYNFWGCTDHYDSDGPLSLEADKDFKEVSL